MEGKKRVSVRCRQALGLPPEKHLFLEMNEQGSNSSHRLASVSSKTLRPAGGCEWKRKKVMIPTVLSITNPGYRWKGTTVLNE